MKNMKKIVAKWRVVEKCPSFPGAEPCEQEVVRYDDGSGNVRLKGHAWYYVDGVPFDCEPMGHLDPAYFNIEELPVD